MGVGPKGVRRGLPLDLTSCDCDGDGKTETGTEDRGFHQRVSGVLKPPDQPPLRWKQNNIIRGITNIYEKLTIINYLFLNLDVK